VPLVVPTGPQGLGITTGSLLKDLELAVGLARIARPVRSTGGQRRATIRLPTPRQAMPESRTS
jgi:hypothetical protein